MSEQRPRALPTDALQTLLEQIESAPITDVPAAMRLNRARAAGLGMTMTEIGKMAGVSSAVWSLWCKGKTGPSLILWERLMATLAELEAKQ